MRLPQRFYRLPVRFDAVRLRGELAALPPEAWAPHPNGDPGNSAVRLISVEGGENDAVNGVMRMTPHLERSPYLRQVLAGFGVVWSRSRLLRLAPGAVVPAHSDINYHWFYRVRLHVPIVTLPEVRFTRDDEYVHMAAGEGLAVSDNWRVHHVENPTDADRIHTSWPTHRVRRPSGELVAQGGKADAPVQHRGYDPAQNATPLTERAILLRPAHWRPRSMDLLIHDLRSELVPEGNVPEQRTRLARYHALLLALGRDWRQLYALHCEEPAGWEEFAKLRDKIRNQSASLSAGLTMRMNR